ncbi:capsular polysaccharide biosynthesis protein [Achromobacter sp. NPDC008082]|uniref:capsular polysaccharide biosynthesis protein n=1 Tax=Achromobacter sp. NPDC008082 TaxID=3363888 RepID=UPI0036ECB9E1
MQDPRLFGTFYREIAEVPGIEALLGAHVRHVKWPHMTSSRRLSAVLGWGLRPTSYRARQWAAARGLPFIALEDGFLRSFGTGRKNPSVSLVVDDLGIYYCATRPSRLEALLESDANLLTGEGANAQAAFETVLRLRLSKYNFAKDFQPDQAKHGSKSVLVVDQTQGDASIFHGLATPNSFMQMLEAARRENPDATIYVKTHPEVNNGAKRGYLTHVKEDAQTVLIRESVNPLSLVSHMDRVYVVTSQLGFEAVMSGKSVTCFGMPWYAGWGATDDRQRCHRRQRQRSPIELFSAAYMHYTRYLNPVTHQRGTIFDATDWLQTQRSNAIRHTGRCIVVGFKRWKATNVLPFLHFDATQVHFVPSANSAARLKPTAEDRLVVWGGNSNTETVQLAMRSGASLLRMEDGFLRSVGLGSDFVPPSSLVMDSGGIYFDPSRPSDLENILNRYEFSDEDRHRAQRVRAQILQNGLTKYNVEPRRRPAWASNSQHVVLVPGQVEDDASIRLGCDGVKTNLDLLRSARLAHPDSLIVYKPHPDVLARNRSGDVGLSSALRYADVVEKEISVVSCLDACDDVHTMTSLTGFDALLRGKNVTVYGRPFYAGWGLTRDLLVIARRCRQLTLDELVAGSLLHYPIYWDWTLRGYTRCEAVLTQLVNRRDHIVKTRGSLSTNLGYSARQWHKLKLWARAGFVQKR